MFKVVYFTIFKFEQLEFSYSIQLVHSKFKDLSDIKLFNARLQSNKRPNNTPKKTYQTVSYQTQK